MHNSNRFFSSVLTCAAVLSIGAGMAEATPVTTPTPTEPMPITVHPKPNINTGQPPIEWLSLIHI